MVKSTRQYSARTLKVLWGRAAGRCAIPTCRIELLAEATEYDPVVIIGEIAHIEAASDAGPRANPSKSRRERDEYDNLILLCQNCHARLDGQKNTNSIEYICRLRNDHEAWVRASLPERGKSTGGWRTIFLQGHHPFDPEHALAALTPDFPTNVPVFLKVDPSQNSWEHIQVALQNVVEDLLKVDDLFTSRLAIFPLAPVTACIAFGYYLTNRPHTKLFQFHRDQLSWSWPDEHGLTDIHLSGLPDVPRAVQGEIAICFSLSASITHNVIEPLGINFLDHIHIYTSHPSTAWLQNFNQLKELGIISRMVFERCLALYPLTTKWHIFYAGPAPGAVIMGQQINPTMSPTIQLYEYIHRLSPPYQPSILLA